VKIHLYLEEDSQDRHLVAALRARGTEVTTALEAGMIERADSDQLAFAAENGWTLYSFNVRDFYQLHAQWLSEGRNHAGIIFARQQQYSVGEQMRRLLKLIATRTSEQMVNAIEFLSVWG